MPGLCGYSSPGRNRGFRVSAGGNEYICGLDVAVNDAFGVRRVQSVGDLDSEFEDVFEGKGLPRMWRFERLAFENCMAMKARPPASPTS